MATTLKDSGELSLGRGYQSQSGQYSNCYGRVASTYTAYDTYYEITVTGYFKYDGWWNALPWEVGVYKVPTSSTSPSTFSEYGHQNGMIDPTLEANVNTWITVGSSTFTIPRDASNSYGAMPYLKLGCMPLSGGNGWPGIGNSYGIMFWDDSTTNTYAGNVGFSYAGVSLHCWCLLAGKTNAYTFSYANCPLVIPTTTPKDYVSPTSFTVFGSSGNPHTVYFR